MNYGGTMICLSVRNAVLVVLSGITLSTHAMERASLVIRKATRDDIEELQKVDQEITDEFFEPLLEQHYAQYYSADGGVKEVLKKDLADDVKTFEECIAGSGDERLHIAYDNDKQSVVGFILSHKNDRVAEVDLLMVAKAYRRSGVGQQLLNGAVSQYADVDSCFLYALNKNEGAHHFYTKFGFAAAPGDADKRTSSGVPHSEIFRYYTVQISALRDALDKK